MYAFTCILRRLRAPSAPGPNFSRFFEDVTIALKSALSYVLRIQLVTKSLYSLFEILFQAFALSQGFTFTFVSISLPL